MSTASLPYVLDRPVAFLAWWKKLAELDEEYTRTLSEPEWSGIGRDIRHLQSAMDHVGRAAGATREYIDAREAGSVEFGTTFLPSFDWLGGQIDFSVSDDEWIPANPERGAQLIARIIEVTGIDPAAVDDSEF